MSAVPNIGRIPNSSQNYALEYSRRNDIFNSIPIEVVLLYFYFKINYMCYAYAGTKVVQSLKILLCAFIQFSLYGILTSQQYMRGTNYKKPDYAKYTTKCKLHPHCVIESTR